MKRIIFMLLMISSFFLTAEEADLRRLQQAGIQLLQQAVPAMNFNVKNRDGEDTDLDSIKGKVALLNFWASWCGPCKAEMPSMEKLYNQFDEENFTIFAVSNYDKPESMTDFFDKNGYSFPGYYDFNNEGSSIYGIQAIPTTFIMNKKGEIVAGIMGGTEWNHPAIIKTIEELISE